MSNGRLGQEASLKLSRRHSEVYALPPQRYLASGDAGMSLSNALSQAEEEGVGVVRNFGEVHDAEIYRGTGRI